MANRPLDERLCRLLMLALYRSGRQADALAAYQDARRALTDELGLEPSKELRDLERDILRQHPLLDAPAALPVMGGRTPRAQLLTPRRLLVAGMGILVVAASIGGFLALRDRDAPAVSVGANSVAVIDPQRLRVIASVPVGRRPLFVTSGAGSVWVAAVADQTLTRIDPQTFRVTATVGLGFEPTDVEAVGENVWVVGGYDHALWRVDRDGVPRLKLRFRERHGPLPVGFERGIAGLSVSAEGLWLAHGNEVSLLDPISGELRADVKVGGTWVNEIDVGTTAFVANNARKHVQSFDPQTLEVGGTVRTAADISDIIVASGYVWIALEFAHLLWQVDEASLALRRTIDIEDDPVALAILDDAIWVVSQDESVVRRVNSRNGRVEDIIEIDHTLEGVAVANDLLWVAVREP